MNIVRCAPSMVHKFTRSFTRVAVTALALTNLFAHAAEVQVRELKRPKSVVESDEGGPEFDNGQAVDLGTVPSSNSMTAPTPAASRTSIATAARAAAVTGDRAARGSSPTRPSRTGVERAVFARAPIRVGLPVGRERLVTLPTPVALHVPDDIDVVARIESIGRTLYITALVPFAPIRVIAEAIDGGQQVPLDLVANESTGSAGAELEVFLSDTERAPGAPGTPGAVQVAAPGEATESPATAADMVELTRYAARMLYGPRRLAVPSTQIQQVEVATAALPALIRGARVEAIPLAQWRSGSLYVTAVRVTNKAAMPVDLPLDNLRGQWVAVTAQHGRLGPVGSDADTTALYLICDRAFEACL